MTLIQQLLELNTKDSAHIPSHTLAMGRLSLFDWIVCGLGGRDEPVAKKIRDHVAAEYANGGCSVFGGNQTSAVAAALANGTISHALDKNNIGQAL